MATSDPQRIEEFLARTRPEQTDGVAVYRREGSESARKPRITLPPPAIDVEYDGSIIGRYGMVGLSPAIQIIYSLLDRLTAAVYPSTVVINGETGTGKELVARAIHNYGPRRGYPFVSLDCSSIPVQLIESELFGHVRGSFTGAVRDHYGAFVQANQGTIFLDEIGNLPLEAQVKILRALQEKEVRPVGSTKPIHFDTHLVAATNTNLEDAVKRGEFREDLYYRLNVVPIAVPTLRDRQVDIPLLIGYFIRKYAQEMQREPITFSFKAFERAICRYLWPGNIRELQNTIERFTVLVDGEITDATLKVNLSAGGYQIKKRDVTLDSETDRRIHHGENIPAVSEAIERLMIRRALEATNGNHSEAARRLGISRSTITRKVSEYSLSEE